MTYASWMPRHRVTTVQPGKLDVFVVTLVNGKVGLFEPITLYEAALGRAHAFIKEHPCQIKVLPMTGDEVRNFLGPTFDPTSFPRPGAGAERQEMIRNLLQIARETNDEDARHHAFDLLAGMGAFHA
jgi:hypothetical protein